MALRHHARNFATRSAHTLSLQAIISHDTANHPAHQRHAAFTPACFALPCGTAPRNRSSHQGRAVRTALRHHGRNFATRCAHTLEEILSHDTANQPAHQRHAAFTPVCFALPRGTAPRKCISHQGRANPHGTANFATRSAHTLYHAIPPIIPLTSDTPRLNQPVSRSRVARRHANALSTKDAQIRTALRHHGRISPQCLPTHYRSNPVTRYRHSSRSPATCRVYTSVSRSPVARRHANALSTKAAQIRMALRHHEISPHVLPTHYN